MTDVIEARPRPRRGLWPEVAAWWGPRPLAQIVVLLALIAPFYVFGANVSASMARVGITPGFAFLERAANFEIGESVIAFHAGDSYARAIATGLLNTVRVAVLGCILATLFGILIGLLRLSHNWLLSALSRWYVEIVRNTPLLLQLFFWIAVAHALPVPRRALSLFHLVFLSNRGVYVPRLVFHDLPMPAAAVLAVVAMGWGVALWLAARSGGLSLLRAVLMTGLAAVAAALTMLAAGSGLSVELPQLSGFNIQGGYSLSPELAALLVGLVVKFSAIIAEIVRAGILSVRKEQWDAARALGLHNGRIIRLIVLPQALRVITPLTTSNYLDLVKDSSLAVAIGYPDLVSIVNTTANTTGQAFEALLILILVYVTLNLSVSLAMNVYNARVALREEQGA